MYQSEHILFDMYLRLNILLNMFELWRCKIKDDVMCPLQVKPVVCWCENSIIAILLTGFLSASVVSKYI